MGDADGSRPRPPEAPEEVVLVGGPLVAGGTSLCRTPEGEVVFVEGALVGEQVAVALDGPTRRPRRGVVTRVLDPAAARVAPTCPHVAESCGGCDLPHAAPAAQPALKADIVVDALRRLGGIADPVVVVGDALAPRGYRTTVRALVVDGRAALRRRRSHDPVVLSSCEVAHPGIEEILIDGRFGPAEEVVVRVGTATGERLVLATPSARGVRVPSDVVVVGADELRRGAGAAYHEVVAGHRYRISARSFFQSSHQGAEALVAAVVAGCGDSLTAADTVVDAYCGVGLLGAQVLRAAAAGGGRPHLVAVEQSSSSVDDARVNLAPERFVDVVTGGVTVRRGSVDDVEVEADLVIADPSRRGLGRGGVRRLAGSGASTMVLVSCDPASLGRDAALLREQGFAAEMSTLVDLFPQTTHVEVVTTFRR